MSKRLYISLCIVCGVLSIAAGFLYWYKISPYTKAQISTNKMLFPKEIKESGVNKVESDVIQNAGEKVSTSTSLSLLAVGDIMLDRSVMLKTQSAGDYNHPFLLIDPLFREYNLHMANLEGPITTNKSVANGTGGARFTFTFSPKFVDPLKNRFEFLSLANNHEYNFGQNGVDQTRKFLGDAGVHYFGDPANTPGFLSVTTTYNDIRLGFVGYHQLIEKGFENVIVEIQRLRPEVDVLIAMPHWGIEYVTNTPSYLQVSDAHKMVDAGVDIIIGAHPHVIEPIEIYNNKVIFYSLGNFIFDQYFSEETMTGLAVGINFEKKDTTKNVLFHLIPLDINVNSQASVAVESKKMRVLSELTKTFIGSEEIKKNIPQGTFEIKL